MNEKIKNKSKKTKKIDRFNRSNKSNFFNNFQNIMTERLNLNYIDKYNEENIEMILKNNGGYAKGRVNTKISNGFLLSCNIEPELYLKIQETIKKLTGNYSPMDELIRNLLTYFCYIYSGPLPKNQLPYKHKYKGKRFSKILTFQKYFREHYTNIVPNVMKH